MRVMDFDLSHYILLNHDLWLVVLTDYLDVVVECLILRTIQLT
jgi:hypothetical protein